VRLPEPFSNGPPPLRATLIPHSHGPLNAFLPNGDGRPNQHHYEAIQLVLKSRISGITHFPVRNRTM
jgi:hypothetical protein